MMKEYSKEGVLAVKCTACGSDMECPENCHKRLEWTEKNGTKEDVEA